MSLCFRLGTVGPYCVLKDKIRLSSLHFCWRASFLSLNLISESAVLIRVSAGYPRLISFTLKCEILVLNSFAEDFVRRSLSASPLMSFGCSAQRLFRLSRRFARARTGRILRFRRAKDRRIATWRNIFPPEMLIAMSFSLKCNVQMFGSISLLFFFFACSLTKNFPLLTVIGLHGETKIVEIRSFLASIAVRSYGTVLVHGPHGKKTAKNGKIRGDFLTIWQKHMAFPTMFAFIFRTVFLWASLRCVSLGFWPTKFWLSATYRSRNDRYFFSS